MRRNKTMEKYRNQLSDEDKALIDDSFSLADRIHFLLQKHGISQRELAIRLNKKESQVSKWLSGSHNFTQSTLTKIGLAIGEKVYLIPDETQKTLKHHKFELLSKFASYVASEHPERNSRHSEVLAIDFVEMKLDPEASYEDQELESIL